MKEFNRWLCECLREEQVTEDEEDEGVGHDDSIVFFTERILTCSAFVF